MFEDCFRTSGEAGSLYHVEDLLGVVRTGESVEDLRRFLNRWDATIAGMETPPDDLVLRDILLRQIRKCQLMKYDIKACDRALEKSEQKSYAYLLQNIRDLLDRERLRPNRHRIVEKNKQTERHQPAAWQVQILIINKTVKGRDGKDPMHILSTGQMSPRWQVFLQTWKCNCPYKGSKRTNSPAPKKKAGAKAAPCITQRYACIATGKGLPKATKAKINVKELLCSHQKWNTSRSLLPVNSIKLCVDYLKHMTSTILHRSQCQSLTSWLPIARRSLPANCRRSSSFSIAIRSPSAASDAMMRKVVRHIDPSQEKSQ